ncbi:MAG: hypothetical protein RQ761_09280 [Bacteroidales bacterium]|nr:hypothetical protein [Bacteroidales bacterium]
MNQQQLSQNKVKKTLQEISEKINEMQAKTYDHLGFRDDLDKLMSKMQKLRDKIQSKYNKTDKSDKKDWDTLEKSIYKDIESFNRAFRKAGELFDSNP